MSRIYDLGGRPAALSTPAVYALTLGLQADALGLTGVQFATPSASKNGVPIAIVSWAWVVTGPCTLDDDEIERPTPTHTGAGTCTRQLVATLADGAVVYSAVDSWTVGVNGWVRKWLFDPSALADHDLVVGALTVDGVEVRNGSEGAVTSFAIASGVLTLDTAAATGGLWIYPVEAMAASRDYEVCWIGGVGAEVTSNNDGCFLQYAKSGATSYIIAEVRRDGGLQKIARYRSGSSGTQNTSGGAQGRAIGLHMAAGRYAFRPLYSTSAWTADTSPEDLIIGGGTPSGWHSSTDVTPAETTDEFFPNAIVGASPDELVLKYRPNNSRTYTIPGLSMWVKM